MGFGASVTGWTDRIRAGIGARIGAGIVPSWLIVQVLGTVMLVVNLAVARESDPGQWIAYGVALAAWLTYAGTDPFRPSVATGALLVAVLIPALVTGRAQDATALIMTAVTVGRLTMRPRPRLPITLATVLVAMIAALIGPAIAGNTLADIAGGLALIGVAALLGLHTRQFRVQAANARELLTQTRRTQAERARAAALDERARIAREMHDVLAHSLGALSVQLELAEALLAERDDPAAALERVRRSRRLAADGLAEARNAVSALRSDLPALPDALDELAANYRRDRQLTITCDVAGSPVPLSPAATVSLLRTATEALTNAAKHAPGAAVTLRLSFTDSAVRLEVVNPVGPSPRVSTDTGGFGLTGMAERLALVGGTLSAGLDDATTEPGGCWLVRAEVPKGAPK